MDKNENPSFERKTGPIKKENQYAAEVLTRSKSEIKNRWEEKVRKLVKSSAVQTSPALRNTLGTFLDELISILKTSDSFNDDPVLFGMSKVHGGERATFPGYLLPQLLKEFSILRGILIEILLEKGVLTHAIRSIIDRSIDSVTSSAATEFASVQNAQTQAALNRSEASNMDLERFAAVAAHDLKSPLATISGYLNLLDEEFTAKLGEEGTQFVRLMIGATNRMRNLIDSLLDYARLSNSKRAFHPTNINNVLKAALLNLNGTIFETHADVRSVHLPVVMGDTDLLTQLFQNLISNAIKFRSKEPPKISIGVEDQNGSWLFSIVDNGIGFDPKYSSEIFTLYKKLHGESEYVGTGIGLATSKRVVELHGGKIWADSKPGIGSTFYFTLPKIKDDNGVVH